MANKNTHTHKTLGPCALVSSEDATGESLVTLDSGEQRTVSTIWLEPIDYKGKPVPIGEGLPDEPAKPDVAKRNKA